MELVELKLTAMVLEPINLSKITSTGVLTQEM